MTRWEWWVGRTSDVEDEGCYTEGGFDSRDAALVAACREFDIGQCFEIVEARSSEAAEHEGADCIPFLRTRHRQTLTVGFDRKPNTRGLDDWPPSELAHVPERVLREWGLAPSAA